MACSHSGLPRLAKEAKPRVKHGETRMGMANPPKLQSFAV
jgi:hypothetical protein